MATDASCTFLEPVALIDELAGDLAAVAHPFPEATYRVQFHAGFTFRDAAHLVPYLQTLGITHLYASPFLQARPGSQHGYDITNHQALNPEIGGEEDFDALSAILEAHGMRLLADIVPNHMGIAGNDNLWWQDVLENGPSSPYAAFFDIDWDTSLRTELHEKVLLPVLGSTYGEALERGQLRLGYDGGAFAAQYFEQRFPIGPGTYSQVLEHRAAELEQRLGPDDLALVEYQSIVTAIKHLPARSESDPQRVTERIREKEVIKRRLAALTEAHPAVRAFVEENVSLFNGTAGEPRSFDPLDALLNSQAYHLSYWRVAADEINYRRFFDINELAALSVEREECFLAAHALIFRLLREGKLHGVRIDHPDGLYDPRQYLERLQRHYVLERVRGKLAAQREAVGEEPNWAELSEPLSRELDDRRDRGDGWLRQPLYVVVEKILGTGELLPADWPTHGTSGYDFLNALNGVFVDAGNAVATTRLYERFTGREESFADVVYASKSLILQMTLSSELNVLAHQLHDISERNRWARDFTHNGIRRALREVVACFPVYRSYINGDEIDARDKEHVEAAVNRARRRNPSTSPSLFDYIRDTLLLRFPEGSSDEYRQAIRRFVGKFQQVTAPVMAKGLEDTAFYRYNRLVSLNEVGGDPDQFGTLPGVFHRFNELRQRRWPFALSATATHDHKRGEDVRARLNVLAEMPREWKQALTQWSRLNRRHRVTLDDAVVPDRNDEYLFYQTLLGAWPFEETANDDRREFAERMGAYMRKATYEAKAHTSWINPHPAFDEALQRFIARVLDERLNPRFLAEFRGFQKRIAHWGAFNGLSQALLKIASPGAPDTYQGTELWDFSLVDPDNRRPVDYALRSKLLAELDAAAAAAETVPGELAAFARNLTEHKEDGRVKLYATSRALRCRREYPELFSAGDYLPAAATADRRDNVVAFVRQNDAARFVVAVPRLPARLVSAEGDLPLAEVWRDSVLLLPAIEPGAAFRNVFTGEELIVVEREGQAALPLSEVFAHFPLALLQAR